MALRAGAHRHPLGATKTRRAGRAGPCPPILLLLFSEKSALIEISDQELSFEKLSNPIWPRARPPGVEARPWPLAYASGAGPSLDMDVGLQHTLKHGAWLPARKERGNANTTANRFIRLRQHCSQILTKLVNLALCRPT